MKWPENPPDSCLEGVLGPRARVLAVGLVRGVSERSPGLVGRTLGGPSPDARWPAGSRPEGSTAGLESTSGPPGRRTARSRLRRRAEARLGMELDRGADSAEDGADLAAQEQQGKDCDDRDECEDQGVFGQALTSLMGLRGKDECADARQHRYRVLLS